MEHETTSGTLLYAGLVLVVVLILAFFIGAAIHVRRRSRS
jgi:hypothetical protein